jgi:hypothetical protein
MGFASTYLDKRALFPEIVIEVPDNQTGIIVVVPSYDEPGICKLLDSLAQCSEPYCQVEVIIVINAPEDASEQSIENNNLTIKNIESWKRENINCFFRLFAFIVNPIIPEWGVGLARKTGMDEAVRRFNSINNADGVILSLDADCVVAQNYFVAVCDELLKRNDRTACSIYFEHPLSGIEFSLNVYESIILYELHLRYYIQCQAYSGFHYVFHTVGSAIAVKALEYVKCGGMNRRQAGEDFYFIQKLVPSPGYFNLISTTVFPSPRASSRVPFGTGPSIGKLSEGNISTLLTYNVQAFRELKSFFELIESFYQSNVENLPECYELLPRGLKSFLIEKEWLDKVIEIKNNTNSLLSFKKRFFGWFNMFKIVKYLNFVHLGLFEKKPVEVAALELLKESGAVLSSEKPLELLLEYRRLEKILSPPTPLKGG